MINLENRAYLWPDYTCENMRYRANIIKHLRLYIARPSIGLGER